MRRRRVDRKTVKMIKVELRKNHLALQKSLSSSERREKSARIAANFFENVDLSRISFLHGFLPIEKFNEIETTLIFEKVWREFPTIKTVVPRVDFQSNEIENLIYTPETALDQNQWHIHEPTHDETIEPLEIDVVIVPLLAFDKTGFRVGYGKGFYDKFLAKCRPDCLKIGVSYFAPVEKISDVNEFDAHLDYCITPDHIWKFEKAVGLI